MKSEALKTALAEHNEVMLCLGSALAPVISEAIASIVACLEDGGKVLVFGNGGSAADAQHFAAELVGRFETERRALSAVALTTDTSAITAIANDYGYESVFERQVEALAMPGDILLGLSTSGNSENIIKAMTSSTGVECTRIAMTGAGGGALAQVADINLSVPSERTARIQEAHIFLIHLMCDEIERHFADHAL